MFYFIAIPGTGGSFCVLEYREKAVHQYFVMEHKSAS